jgi:hypothetical protein
MHACACIHVTSSRYAAWRTWLTFVGHLTELGASSVMASSPYVFDARLRVTSVTALSSHRFQA